MLSRKPVAARPVDVDGCLEIASWHSPEVAASGSPLARACLDFNASI
jgi:hypothetical protein